MYTPLDDDQTAAFIEAVAHVGGFLYSDGRCTGCKENFLFALPTSLPAHRQQNARVRKNRPPEYAIICLVCDEGWKIPKLRTPEI